jgi:lactate dehydrogenase-like 2-hydroxyacid dehydrogenase
MTGGTMNSRPVVVVTRAFPQDLLDAVSAKYDARINRNDAPMTAEQLAHAMRTADALVCTVTDRVRADVIGTNPRVRIIANFGVGVNHIDLAAAKAAGVAVTNTPDVLTDDTADIALALILMSMRRLGEGERYVRTGAWSGWRPTQLLGRSAKGKTVGIVGYGRIGRALARRAVALGMHVIWHAPRDPRIDDPATDGPPGAVRVGSLEDVVSLHCPATPETRHLMNARTLALMKPDAFLVNTARGDVVDEYALAETLRERRIAGAGLDVYEFEPSVVAELKELQNVVLLPHLGSATVETRSAMGMKAFANLDAFLGGATPPDRVV